MLTGSQLAVGSNITSMHNQHTAIRPFELSEKAKVRLKCGKNGMRPMTKKTRKKLGSCLGEDTQSGDFLAREIKQNPPGNFLENRISSVSSAAKKLFVLWDSR